MVAISLSPALGRAAGNLGSGVTGNPIQAAASALLSAGARGVLPTVHTDGLWYQDRAFTRPWKYPEDLEKQVEGVLDPSGFPVPVQFGPNQILNGSFDTSLANWTNPDTAPSSTTWSNGAVLFTVATTGTARLRQQRPTVVGKKYRVGWRVVQVTGTPGLTLTLGITANGDGAYGANTCPTAGQYSVTITATSTLLGLAFVGANAAGGTALVDDVTVQEVIEDWSWLGPNLVTNGDFSNGTTGWSVSVAAPATVTASTGKATIVSPAGESAFLWQAVLSIGRVYVVTGDITVRSGSAKVSLGDVETILSTTQSFRIVGNCRTDGLFRLARNTACDVDFDNISVREIIGHPLIAPAAGTGVVPTARVNLLSRTTFAGATSGTPGTAPTGWSVGSALGTQVAGTADAAGNVPLTLSNNRLWYFQTITCSASVSYDCTVEVLSVNSGTASIENVVTTSVLPSGATIQYLRNGSIVSGATLVSSGDRIGMRIAIGATAGNVLPRIGNGTSSAVNGSITIWKPEFRPTFWNSFNLPAYQRVGDGTAGVFDYDHVGFPVRLESQVNGRGLRSAGTVNFTNTDALHAGAVVAKTSDAAPGILMELGASIGAVNGGMYMLAPSGANSQDAQGASKGTVATSAIVPSIPAPRIMALQISSKISTDSFSISNNGVVGGLSASDQGTGNYGDHVLNLFGRDLSGTPSLRFTGGMFGTPFIVDGNVITQEMAAAILRRLADSAGLTY